jgi:hypothetical protein
MIGTFRLGNGSSFRPLATLYCRPCRFALMVRPKLRRSSSLAYPDVVQVPEVPMEESLDSIAESLGSNTGVVAQAPAVPTEVKSTLTSSSSCTDIVHVQVFRTAESSSCTDIVQVPSVPTEVKSALTSTLEDGMGFHKDGDAFQDTLKESSPSPPSSPPSPPSSRAQVFDNTLAKAVKQCLRMRAAKLIKDSELHLRATVPGPVPPLKRPLQC